MQRSLMEWLGLQHPALAELTIHVPNGRDAGSAKLGGLWKAMGVKAGVPDVLCFARRGGLAGLALELKVAPNKPSAEQLWWRARLSSEGWASGFAYTLDEAMAAFDRYARLT
jgi:hypothetical protein